MLDRFFNGIIRRRRLVIALFLAAAAICGLMALRVKVNYDMADYLPRDAPSSTALNVMEEEFSSGTPNARAMVRGVSLQEALAVKERLSNIDGVSGVTWLDDVVDLKQPLEIADAATVESYYKDGSAVFSFTVAKGEESRIIGAVYDIVGQDGAVSGEAAGSATYQALSVQESGKAFALLIPTIILILLFATNSYLEPLLFLLSIGVSIVLNVGTNLLMGEVSYITNSISPILQMAVSLDYAIFLLHSFDEFRRETDDVHAAMGKAMRRSFPAVMASAMTTLFGFLVLTLMRFRLGGNLGLSLAKGIVFSLIGSMLFLPALTICCVRLLDKTHHRQFLPSFTRTGKGMLKLRIPLMILAAVLIVPAFLAQRSNAFTYGTGELDRSSRAGQDEQAISDAFGNSVPMVILVPKGEPSKEKALSDGLAQLDGVDSVISYAGVVGAEIPPQYLDQKIVEQFYSAGYSRIILYADTLAEGDEAFRLVARVRALAAEYYGDAALTTGQSAVLYDMRDVITSDDALVNGMAILAIGLVLLFTFRSLSLPLILLLTIETAIWINLSIPYFQSMSLSYIGYLVISTVQLGATVDYAILFTDHYVHCREALPKRQAAEVTITSSMGSILISGSILAAAGFMLSFTSTNEIVSEMGLLIGRGALLSLAMVLFFLPGLLLLTDGLIRRTTLGCKFIEKEMPSHDAF